MTRSAIVAKDAAVEDVGVETERRREFTPTPEDLREKARMYAETSKTQTNQTLLRAFARVGLALVQLSNCIERHGASAQKRGLSSFRPCFSGTGLVILCAGSVRSAVAHVDCA